MRRQRYLKTNDVRLNQDLTLILKKIKNPRLQFTLLCKVTFLTCMARAVHMWREDRDQK